MADKIGSQVPTKSVVLPYEQTKGLEAVELYNKTERAAMEWQELLCSDIMAVNEDGLWTHSKFGYAIPRRNGKGEVLIMREAWGFANGEKIMHTAHRTTTSHSAWERIVDMLVKAGYQEDKDFKTHKQYGLEDIVWIDDIHTGKINFRTRSSKGGLGEGYDLLVIDEAQEYTIDQASALKYVVSDSLNPQTIMCGTPPTLVSSGTVFLKTRQNVLAGDTVNTGWAEWSVESQCDPKDKDKWYDTNPSLGIVLSERAIYDEIGEDDIDFNIQRLGLWLQYNQKSAITKAEWQRLQTDTFPNLDKSTICVGIKFGYDGANVALSVAAKTNTGHIFVECIDCQSVRNGFDWLIEWINGIKPHEIVVDGANGQGILENTLKELKIRATLPTVKEIIRANSIFEQALFNETILHMEQPSLEQSVSNCEKRAIGTAGGFGYKSLREGIEIALLDSVILAHFACTELKERKVQRVSY